MTPSTLQEYKALFQDAPLAAIAGAQLLAIVALFSLLIRSYSKRIDAADAVASALAKMQLLHERTVGVLEDISVLQKARAKRRLAAVGEEK